MSVARLRSCERGVRVTFWTRHLISSPDCATCAVRSSGIATRIFLSWSSLPVLIGSVVLAFVGLNPGRAQAQTPVPRPTDIARGRPVVFSPAPNYVHTTDPADAMQLTDGARASGTMWLSRSAVGWQDARPVVITVDLQESRPVSAVSFSTAAGIADVRWPRSIFVLASDDGRSFEPLGDMVNRSPPPGGHGYAAFTFRLDRLSTAARYIAFVVDPVGEYTFCDEIRVLSGDATVRGTGARSVTSLDAYFRTAHTRTSVRLSLERDIVGARAELAALPKGAAARQLAGDLDRAARAVNATADATPADGFKAVLPINDLERKIFAIRGAIARAGGAPPFAAWAVNPWEPVTPVDRPSAAGRIELAALPGETRAAAVELSNASPLPMTVALRALDERGRRVEDIRLFEAIWTDTADLVPVADALRPLDREEPSIVVPAGMARLIWISYRPALRANAPSPADSSLSTTKVDDTEGVGSFAGSSRALEATFEARLPIGFERPAGQATAVRIPMTLRVLNGRMPDRRSLHLGGWDYSDAPGSLGVTTANRRALVAALQALGVDSPWAPSRVLPSGTVDPAGHLMRPPETVDFDRWLDEWPDASHYYVFLGARDLFADVPMSDDTRFAAAVGDWARFWSAHMAARRLEPSQLRLLLVDEPHSAADDDRVVRWGGAIKAAAAGIAIWEDPTFEDPGGRPPRLLEVTDIVALKRALLDRVGDGLVERYRASGSSPRLALYGAAPNVRRLDPYVYHRLQAWKAAALGADASFFWSFADDGGGRAWNEYAAGPEIFSPLFMDGAEVLTSRHAEAIREGAEDFEYVEALRAHAAELGVASATGGRDLLPAGAAIARVVDSAGASERAWERGLDRSMADRVRLQIYDALASIGHFIGR